MFNRRRRDERARLEEFIQQTARWTEPSSPTVAQLFQEAFPDPADAGPSAEADEDFLPPSLRAPGERQFAGRMMRFPGLLEIDGTIRTCPVCGVDRDWLVLCSGPDIRLRCRSAHETREPALTSAWYDAICGPVDETFTSKEEGIAKEGFDGTFSGTTFPA